MEALMRTKLALTTGILLLAALPLAAHHSITGEYDANKPITLKGAVTKIEWTNPHARIYIDVPAADGKVTNWNIELAAVSALVRAGWTSRSLKINDTVTVEGLQAKSGTPNVNARNVTLPDGRKVFSGAADQ
jgi:hypothetical protein